MNSLILQGLTITIVGMSLVFGSLLLLWALMALLMKVQTARQPKQPSPTAKADMAAPPDQPSGEELAAIALALALLREEQEAEAALRWRLPPVLTRWVAVGFGRQLRSWQPRRTRRDA